MEKSLVNRITQCRRSMKEARTNVSRLKKDSKRIFDELQTARMALTEAEISAKHGGDNSSYATAYERVEHLKEDHARLRDELRNAEADHNAQEQAFQVLQSEAASDYYPKMMEVVNRYRDQEQRLDAIKKEWQELNQQYALAKLEVCRVPRVKKINPEQWNMRAYSPENDLQNVKNQYGI